MEQEQDWTTPELKNAAMTLALKRIHQFATGQGVREEIPGQIYADILDYFANTARDATAPQLTTRRIVDSLCNATSWSHYWCGELALPKATTGAALEEDGWDGRGWMEVFTNPMAQAQVLEDCEGMVKWHVVTHEMAVERVAHFARDAPRHARDLVTGADDAITGDVLLQYLAFDRLVYG